MSDRHYELYILQPKAATNLVSNPSIEKTTTGYTAKNGVLARVATQQRRGAYALELTPQSGVESGCYYTVSLTAGTLYSFSADVLDVAGQYYWVFFADTSGNPLGTPTGWTGTGHWTRRSVSYTPISTGNHRVYLLRAVASSTAPIYTDGWQVESGLVSTYFDGDCRGANRLRRDYFWTGAPHASPSVRSGLTRTGGTMFAISSVATILHLIGFGLTPLVHHALPLNGGGSFYQDTVPAAERLLTVPLFFEGDQSAISAKRRALAAALNPFATPTPEPLILRAQVVDASGEPAGDPVDIQALYAGGLEGDTTQGGASFDRAALSFTSYLPFVQADGTHAAGISFSTSIANGGYLLKRGVDGLWASLGTLNNKVWCLAKAPDGSVYFGGDFTTINGTTINRIARYDPLTGTISALGSGLNGTPYWIAIGPDGMVYVAGSFTTADGITVNRIARYDPATGTWSALGTGLSGSANTLLMSRTGILFVGGDYVTAGATTVNGLASWDGTNWSAVPGWTSGAVNALAEDSAGMLYIGGSKSGNPFFAKYDGVTCTTLTAPPKRIYALAFGPDGRLYAGIDGNIGATTTYLYAWTGLAWQTRLTVGGMALFNLYGGPTGKLYIPGSNVNGVGLPCPGFLLNGDAWEPIDLLINGAFQAFLETETGELYAGGTWTTATTAALPIIDTGSVRASPVFTITGPGRVWQVRNYTTGQGIVFNGLTLLPGETAVLDLRPGNFDFTSSFRGSLKSYLAGSGADLDFVLLPGENKIAVFVTGSDANTTVTMTWSDLLDSLDDAAWSTP